VPDDEELEGTTFKVYLYVVKDAKPVGPRDVMRGVNLSSPSVACRHLQKLETLGLLQKNAYGEYVVREKANIKGHVWIG
jgi:predicted transcriptional regulator